MSFTGQTTGYSAFEAPLDERMNFIRKTYLYLTGAVFAFVALCVAFYTSGVGESIARMISGSQYAWLLVLGAFMLVSWMATAMAAGSQSVGVQYAGLFLYTVAQALIFSPLIFIAAAYAPGVLPTATLLTLLVFGSLSVYVLTTKKDFSFMRGALMLGGIVALGLIVGGAIFGFQLGLWFSVGMVIFAGGAVLYSTSNVLHKYQTGMHVGAALELFAAIALLFWYILNILMELRR
ncbi:MAG: Bax inhibitor-1 family protein [Fimbriimonadaceae bacterium]